MPDATDPLAPDPLAPDALAPDPLALDALAIAAAVNAGRLGAAAVTEAALARIAARNGALNALVAVDPERSRREAAAVAARVAAGERLPLAGVPFVVKDNVFAAGWRITQGSRLFAEHVAPADAVAVARARAAGAVVVGIGACSEFACKGATMGTFHGPTRHPQDEALGPGGSSGGNASALAAGFAPIALGTDAGGSGRRPAAHCGVVGFKPSQGAVPVGPGFAEPVWGHSTNAPMGRSVADVAALFAVVAGPHPSDPGSRLLPIEGAGPARVAVSPRLGLDAAVDDDAAAGFEAAVAALERAGVTTLRADPAWRADGREDLVLRIQHAGLAHFHGARYRAEPGLFDPDIGAQVERGLALTGAEVGEALEASFGIARSLAAFFEDGPDLLLCPTTPCVAWAHDRAFPEVIGGRPAGPRGHAAFTPLLNHAGAPALSLPCGRGRGGLPLGLQVIGPRGADARVLAFAALAERAMREAGLWEGLTG